MNTITLMQIDAALLILAAMGIATLVCADQVFRPIVPAIPLALIGGTSFLQAMWLLGVWVPGAAGYPWPRLGFDAAFFALVVWRTIVVIIEHRTETRRCAELRRRQHRARMNG